MNSSRMGSRGERTFGRGGGQVRGQGEMGGGGKGGEERRERGGIGDLDEALLEQDLDDFFEDGQQAGVVQADPPLQHGQDGMYVRQPPILLTQDVHSVPENALHHLLLSVIVQVHVNHLHKKAGLP